MEQISYKLEVFEGPMDLLLHLISKHKLNIYDIPIIELVEQYIAYVKKMQESDMYVASEFLEMAARLVYIKTVSLLPVYEEAEDLKKELTGELLEYRDCQLMAGKLAKRTEGFDRFVREPIQKRRKASLSCAVCRRTVTFGFGCDLPCRIGACQNQKAVFGWRGRRDARGIARGGF